MDSIHLSFLEKMTSISSLKVILVFANKHKKSGSRIFEYALSDVAKDAEITTTTAKKAIEELLAMNAIEIAEVSKGRTPTQFRYRADGWSLDGFPSSTSGEWKRVTGSKQEEPDPLPKVNFCTRDINSVSVVNNNIYKTDKELGKIAAQLLKEHFYPYCAKSPKPKHWFIQQTNTMKDLLVKYRTEQVMAAVEYWTQVNPPPSGISSMKFIAYENKQRSNVMTALDYYKQEYMKVAHEDERKRAEEKIEEAAFASVLAEKKKNEEKQKVDQTSNEEFVSNLLSSLGSIGKT